MAVSRATKEVLKDQIAERFQNSTASLVAEYAGITAEELASLRVELRNSQTEFRIIKNRVAKKAIEHSVPNAEAIKPQLKGPVGVAHMYGDVAAGTKVLLAFAKQNEKFKVTGGVMDGKALTAEDIKALSELPSKEELIAKIIGTLVSPHRGLLQVMNGVGSNLVRVINAIKDTKS